MASASTHSGRLVKIMIEGTDNLFGIWLSFFREHLSTFVTVLVLLPLTLFLNWRLALLLIVLLVIFSCLSVLVISRTEEAQAEVQSSHSELAERAGDVGQRHVLWQVEVHRAGRLGQRQCHRLRHRLADVVPTQRQRGLGQPAEQCVVVDAHLDAAVEPGGVHIAGNGDGGRPVEPGGAHPGGQVGGAGA